MLEYVVILHGILLGSNSMNKIADSLDEAGYEVCNINYPSTKLCLDETVDYVFKQITPILNRNDSIVHFVGHSLGGLIIRALLHKYHPYNLGRVVMLATPNKGTEFADFFANHWAYKKIFGAIGATLCTDQTNFITQLGKVNYELGVIAGCVSYNPFANIFFKEKLNDGLIAVHNTYIEGMTDHLVVDNSHILMLFDEDVIFEIAHFLKNGSFFGGMIRVKVSNKKIKKKKSKIMNAVTTLKQNK
jgi:triacylglycerol lipase